MDYLFDRWEKIKERLIREFLFLFLDYDGTLSPIVETPDKAVISQKTKELLDSLSRNHNCKLAIITGRSLKDIKHKIGLKNIIYIGNHGLEIEGPKIKFESPISPRSKSVIRHIYEGVSCRLSKIKGIIIEDKNLTLSIHYRLAKEASIASVKKIIDEITQPYLVRNKIKINPGKKVIEIKPPIDWDKGKVVLWLLARQQFELGDKQILPIYIGDDITDEDAFKALKNKGLTIFVGKPTVSEASYYLKNTQEVADFMERILGIVIT